MSYRSVALLLVALTVPLLAQKETPFYNTTALPLRTVQVNVEAGLNFNTFSDTKDLIGYSLGVNALVTLNDLGVVGEIGIRRPASPNRQFEIGAGYSLYTYDAQPVRDILGDMVYSGATYDTYKVAGRYRVKEHNQILVRGGLLSQTGDAHFDYDNNTSQGGSFSGVYAGIGQLSRVRASGPTSESSEELLEYAALDLLIGSHDAKEKMSNGFPGIVKKSGLGVRGSYLWIIENTYLIRVETGYNARYLFIGGTFGFTFGF